MNGEFFQFFHGNGSVLVPHQHHAVIGHNKGRHFDDLRAVHFTDNAFDDHFLRTLTVLEEFTIRGQQHGNDFRGHKDHASLFGCEVVGGGSHQGENVLIDMSTAAVNGSKVVIYGNITGLFCHHFQTVFLNFGVQNLVGLTFHAFRSRFLNLLILHITLIDNTGERTVVSQCNDLFCIADVKRCTVTGSAALGIVVHGHGVHRGNVNGVGAVELIVIVHGFGGRHRHFQTLGNPFIVFFG